MRDKDWIHYSHFEKGLFSKINCADSTNHEITLLQELQSIGEGLKELETYYEGMLQHCEKERYGAIIQFAHTKVGLVILIPDKARHKLIEWVDKTYPESEYKKDLLDRLYYPARSMDFPQEELYLLWRVSHTEAEKKSCQKAHIYLRRTTWNQ